MKRAVSIVLALGLAVGSAVPCLAKTVSNRQYGMEFTLSDSWIDDSDADGLYYYHQSSQEESISVHAIERDWAYSMTMVDEWELKSLCDDFYSDSNLSRELSDQNETLVSVHSDSVLTNYEVYNGVMFFRYEKAYTASAIGYRDTPFYDTAYVTVKNGRVYFISYSRNDKVNHFSDLVSMLKSLSFQLGEIKILVNGNRIYPDCPPVIYQDRTLVPIRAIAEAMGYEVSWSEENQLVMLDNGESRLYFQIDNDVAVANQQSITLDVPPMTIEDRTFLPLRAVAEAMNARVDWDGNNNMVKIWQ